MLFPRYCLGLYLLFCSLEITLSFSTVPLLIWSNDKTVGVNFKDAVLGKTLTEKEVEEKYIAPSLKEVSHGVVLFVFDKLNMDDFTKYSSISHKSKSSVFENTKEAFTTNKGILVPSVQAGTTGNIIKYLKKAHQFDNVIEIFSTDLDVDNWESKIKLDKEKKSNLFIVHMLPVDDGDEENKKITLSQNDDIIGQLLKKVTKTLKDYTVFLTAEQPSELPDAMLFQSPGGRHLLQTKENDTGRVFNSGCVLMFAKGLALGVKNSSAEFNGANYTVTGQCKQKNVSTIDIQFTINLPKGVQAFKLNMGFQLLRGNDWKCIKMEGTYSGTLNGTKETSVALPFDCTNLASPTSYSYACGKSVFTDKSSGMTMTYKSFQIQPFVTNGRFSDAVDCVGFFTIPIFMGLFVSLLLLAILMMGVVFMMNIQTMDRFDDPKGPTIQVPHE